MVKRLGKGWTLVFVIVAIAFIWACGYKVAEHNYEEEYIPVEIVPIEHLTTAVEITEEEEVLIDEHRNMDSGDIYDEYVYSPPETSYEVEEEETEVHTVEYTFTEDEIWEMTRIVYLENGIDDESTDMTIYLTACVILNRLYDWEECDSVYDVIWQGGQYSTANRYEDYNGNELGASYPDGWRKSYEAVCMAIENCDRNPHFQSTFAQGTVYYVDPNTGETFC